MAPTEITDFLTEQATGVLCLSKDDRAYGIPMSFAYDAEEDRAIMDLGFAGESKKREFLETTAAVCLTVYEWHDPHTWTSVVVTGSLEALSEDEVDNDLEAWYYRVAKDIEVPNADIDLEWYELQVDERSGAALLE